MALLEPAALGPQLHHRDVRRVVDEQRRAGDLADALGQARPVVVAHLAGSHVLQVNARLGRQQAHHDLGAAHLQREDDRGLAVLDARRAGEVERQRALTHGGTGRDDDQLAGVQTVGDLVEIGETGRNAGEGAIAIGDRLHLFQRRVDQLLEHQEVIAGAPLGDGEDLGLRPVDGVFDLGRLVVAELGDPHAGLDQAAADRLLGDDLGVVAGIRSRRHRLDQGVQIRGAADPVEHPAAVQLGGDAHRVSRLALAVELGGDLEDRRVSRPVEIGDPHHLDDVSNRVFGQQHSAEHALLGGDILRRRAVELRAARPAPEPRLTTRARTQIDGRHRHRNTANPPSAT